MRKKDGRDSGRMAWRDIFKPNWRDMFHPRCVPVCVEPVWSELSPSRQWNSHKQAVSWSAKANLRDSLLTIHARVVVETKSCYVGAHARRRCNCVNMHAAKPKSRHQNWARREWRRRDVNERRSKARLSLSSLDVIIATRRSGYSIRRSSNTCNNTDTRRSLLGYTRCWTGSLITSRICTSHWYSKNLYPILNDLKKKWYLAK